LSRVFLYPAVRFPEMIIGIIRVLPIPPCGCRCYTRGTRSAHRRPQPVRHHRPAGRPRSGRVTAGPDPAAARAAAADRTTGAARGAGGAGRTTRERGDGRSVSFGWRTFYIIRRFGTGRLTDETHWLPNKEMTKLSEVSDETSTKLFPHF
jgi:hypothetical protein